VDVVDEVHEKHQVVPVGSEEAIEGQLSLSNLIAELPPLVCGQLEHRLAMPIENDHDLADEVLVVVDVKGPVLMGPNPPPCPLAGPAARVRR